MVAFDEIETVSVCVRCGRGFPPWCDLSTRVDGLAVWWTQTECGPTCGGRILQVDRRAQIERIDNEEFFRGEQWTPEEIAIMMENSDAKKDL